MPLRVSVLLFAVAVLAIYTWKDWYKALCVLIVMTALMEHRDMPRNLFGILGLNLWNVLMLNIVLSWLARRRAEGLRWDMPRGVNGLLLLCMLVLLVGVVRAVLAGVGARGANVVVSIGGLSFYLLRWVVPGLLLFHGCRTRRRLLFAVLSILAFGSVIAIQVIRWAPAAAAFDSAALKDGRQLINKGTGLNACDLSAFLAGVAWAFLAMLMVSKRMWQKLAACGGWLVGTWAQALTGGRAGFIAWGATGLVLCALRWRKWLLVAPIMPLILALAFPAATARMFLGLAETDVGGKSVMDEKKVFSGRTVLWTGVIAEIQKSPLIGHGFEALRRTKLVAQTGAGHPHNMFLELLLDNGVLGAIPVLLLFGLVLLYSGRLLLDRTHPWCSAAGGLSLCLVLSQLVAGMGAQHFYPRPSTVGMWAAIFLMFRVRIESAKARHRMTDTATPRSLALRSPGQTQLQGS